MNTISRRNAIRSVVAIATITGAPAILRGRYQLFAQSKTEYSKRAVQLMTDATVVDLLNQFRWADHSKTPPDPLKLWLTTPGTFTSNDLELYRRSGINAFALGLGADSYEAGLRFFARWNGFISDYSDVLHRVTVESDFAEARNKAKIGILPSMQRSDHFRTPDDVDEFFGLGQRISQLTYNFANRVGSGFLERKDGGLTEFGHSILERMEKAGMAADLSHCADQTTLDALDAASKPPLVTHATCRSLNKGHLRAKTDEAIQKLAKKGGVMGIMFVRYVVRDLEPVGIPQVLDHFDHVRGLVGVEHLAVGSDLDVIGNATPVGAGGEQGAKDAATANFDRYRYHVDRAEHEAANGLDHPQRMFDLTEGLISRGYSDADIKMILGGNAVRVLGEIWRPRNSA